MIDREFNLSPSDEFSSRSDGWEFRVSGEELPGEEPPEAAPEPADEPQRDARKSRLLVQVASAAMATVVVANALGVDLLGDELEDEPPGIVWSVDEMGTLEIGGRGPVGKYFIGSDPPWAEFLGEITGVTIGSGITGLDGCAFGYSYGLNGPNYEQGSRIRSVSLSDTVSYVDFQAFMNQERLEEITVDEGNPVFASFDRALYSKDMKTLVFSPPAREPGEFVVPESVTRIENWACYMGKLRSVVLPAGLKEIGDFAFGCCYDLRSAEIPDGVTRIGSNAFYCCALERVAVPASVEELGAFNPFAMDSLRWIEVAPDNPGYVSVDGVVFTKDGSTIVAFPSHREGAYAVPEGVTHVGAGAFCYYSHEKLVLPDSLTKIEWESFYNCYMLRAVEIPAGLSVIPIAAFSECGSLERVTFKGDVEKIESMAFFDAMLLREVRFLGSAPEIAPDAFGACGSFVIRYPAGDSSWDGVVGSDYGAASITWIAE